MGHYSGQPDIEVATAGGQRQRAGVRAARARRLHGTPCACGGVVAHVTVARNAHGEYVLTGCCAACRQVRPAASRAGAPRHGNSR